MKINFCLIEYNNNNKPKIINHKTFLSSLTVHHVTFLVNISSSAGEYKGEELFINLPLSAALIIPSVFNHVTNIDTQ